MHALTRLKSAARLPVVPFPAAILLLAFWVACSPASAKPRASSAGVNTVQACAIKAGKHRGSLRLISAGKRCKRGERRIVWSVLGPPGPQGATGANGSPGEKGSQGSAGTEGAIGPEGKTGSEGQAGAPGVVDLSLKELVETQGEQIETLTDNLNATTSLLQGVTHEQLTSAVDAGTKLNGIAASDIEGAITNADKLVGITTTELNKAIATIPKVTALCTRTTALTNQANSLLTGLGGISLGGLLPVGLELKIPSLPAQLTTFACP
jgi:collagen triple helix repeat protein